MSIQTDPMVSITDALRKIVSPMGVRNVLTGWPDPTYTSVESNQPVLYVTLVTERGHWAASAETVHATVPNPDGVTATVYREKMRKVYQLRLSLFTATADELKTLGWQIEEFLIANPRLVLGNSDVETAMFRSQWQSESPTDPAVNQRDMMFEVTARVLDVSTAYLLKNLSLQSDPSTL
ncbi:hypothetical protein JJB07_06110 [Tumebacillus sp. ITR2]|uniref:Uncharacterized protein n=1 Tax=Tumebacillus amylolyticus TaxID=2801339 RepID=A0ABS1J7Q8_9BACL|nr:hypothetical protein [Tumebacillus amylolyticus]MBL0386225.1 hypothetical protein [Tumebacillus amylolyticus]